MNKIKEPKCLKPANKKAGLMTLKIGLFLAISIGSLELVSYIWLDTVYKDTRRIDINNSLYVPAPYTGYQLRPNFKNPSYQDGHLSINSNGFRGDDLMERENVALRIACLGGSTTFSIKVGNDTTYPKLLESKLRNNLGRDDIEVINCGVGAYTTAESLATLNHRVLPLKPDIAIVYHAVNDVHPRVTGDFDPGYNHYRKALNLNLPTLYPAQSFSIFARLFSRISLSGSSSHIRHLTTQRKLLFSTML